MRELGKLLKAWLHGDSNVDSAEERHCPVLTVELVLKSKLSRCFVLKTEGKMEVELKGEEMCS